jgi:hypothetical protein
MPQKLFDDEVFPGQWYDARLYWPPGMIANPDGVSVPVLTAIYVIDAFLWNKQTGCLWYKTPIETSKGRQEHFWSRPDGDQRVEY